MAFVERLLARHDVVEHVAQVALDLLEVVAGHHRLHARQRQRLGGVDPADARMRMGAAQHLADQHARRRHVGAELGAARDLVEPVGAQGAGPDDIEFMAGGDGFEIERHQRASLISAAALITARTILS